MWLVERPLLEFDDWVESIPFDETRRYSRRVLQTFGTYMFLRTGQLPQFPARVPAAPQ